MKRVMKPGVVADRITETFRIGRQGYVRIAGILATRPSVGNREQSDGRLDRLLGCPYLALKSETRTAPWRRRPMIRQTTHSNMLGMMDMMMSMAMAMPWPGRGAFAGEEKI